MVTCILRWLFTLAVLSYGLLPASADNGSYFKFSLPSRGTQWINGKANPIVWTKGLLDGVNMFDLEIARLGSEGLLLAALNVPANSGKLNIFIQDVPPGDDYYLIFLNSTHGIMYAVSPRFSILPASASTGSGNHGATVTATNAPVAKATTVTLSGAPNPTAQFATTFPVLASGARSGRLAVGLACVVFGVVGATTALL